MEKLQVWEGESQYCRYGTVALQGWRDDMEDEVIIVRDWAALKGHGAADFIGVYDGHYGSHVAKFCKKYLHHELLQMSKRTRNLQDMLKESFLRMDVLLQTRKGQAELCRPDVLNEENNLSEWSEADLEAVVPPSDIPLGGACGIVALVFEDKVVVANAGDCRCVLSRGGQAVDLSTDHKPTMTLEYERIIAAGGFVNAQGRISGVFNMSRGFGDFVFKNKPELPLEQQLIVAVPEVLEMKIGKGDEFLVLASDGVWFPTEKQAESSQRVVNSLNAAMRMYPGITLAETCLDYMESFLAPSKESRVGTDNMSMVLAQFKMIH